MEIVWRPAHASNLHRNSIESARCDIILRENTKNDSHRYTDKMSSSLPRLESEVRRHSAKKTLRAIARLHRRKLVFTLSLVAAENLLFLAYPLFAGYAVDAILRKDAGSALLYSLMVLAFWIVGSARRSVDTRTFTRIYAELAVPVILNQRQRAQATSTVAARVVLARQFVDFFEMHVPMMVTAFASIVGASVMLLIIEPVVGIGCLAALLLFAVMTPSFTAQNQLLHGRLNDRLEKEVRLVETAAAGTLLRHYGFLSKLRTRLSDREAIAFLYVGLVAASLFAVAILRLATEAQPSAGHIYAVMTYLWTFVTSVDEAPGMLDQIARLKDIGVRVDPGQISDE